MLSPGSNKVLKGIEPGEIETIKGLEVNLTDVFRELGELSVMTM
jgi:hypothetical protein